MQGAALLAFTVRWGGGERSEQVEPRLMSRVSIGSKNPDLNHKYSSPYLQLTHVMSLCARLQKQLESHLLRNWEMSPLKRGILTQQTGTYLEPCCDLNPKP